MPKRAAIGIPSEYYSIDSLIERSARLLIVHAKTPRPSVGFYPQEIGIGAGSATTTALCIRALAASGIYGQEVLSPLVDELLDFQVAESGCFGRPRGACHNFSTAKSIATALLLRPESTDSLRMERALRWLLGQRNPDTKGWGYQIGYPTRQYYTFFAVEAIAIAAETSTSDEHRALYLEALSEVKVFIYKTQVADGIWSGGNDDHPCPIGTTMALASLRRLRRPLRTQDDVSPTPGARRLLEAWFLESKNWSNFIILEPGQAFYIREFFPGNSFLLLDLFGPFDILVTSSIGWLQRNFISFNGTSIGWGLGIGASSAINIWATAQALYSLSLFKSVVRGQVVQPAYTMLESGGRTRSILRINAFDFALSLWITAAGLTTMALWLIIHYDGDNLIKIWQKGFRTDIVDLKTTLEIVVPIIAGLGFCLFQLRGLMRNGRYPWRKLRNWLVNKMRETFHIDEM